MKQMDAYYGCMNEIDTNIAALDLNLITALSALIEHQSVTSAAQAVGRTQSAMSHSLARLRDHFRDPILVRDGWSMHLTPLGEDLRPRVAAAAQAARAVFQVSGKFDPATTTRRIRIATPDLCAALFTGLIRDLATLAPKTSVEFIDGASARQAVLTSQADVALAFGQLTPDTNLILHQLAPLNWCTFAPADHSFARHPSPKAWATAQHVVVGQSGTKEGPIERAVRQAGLTRHILCYASNFSAALALAADTGALFTTLEEPFKTTAHHLGLTPCPLPFEMPRASATLIFRADYGDPFSLWLQQRCRQAFR